jgi:uncharacterized membrane protein
MDTTQSLENASSHLERQQNAEVTTCIASTSSGNCDAVDDSYAHISEGEAKRREKKNRRWKKKSKARDSENVYVAMNSFLTVLYIYLYMYIFCVLNSYFFACTL